MKFKRIFLIITDGLGVGFEPRSREFGDVNPDTLGHIYERTKLEIRTWKKLGIASIAKLANYKGTKTQTGYTFKVQELSNAKDTLAGHWEMMGIRTEVPFPVFTATGFPADLITELSARCDGRKIVGNKAASGTVIIDELAHEEIDNHALIVYTSADSVLQICGHEETMGLENLYKYARIAREICSSRPEWNVGRIIARPYQGETGNFQRTANRHDLALQPPRKTLLDSLVDYGINTTGIGKISDIFSGKGICKSLLSKSNNDGMDITIDLATEYHEQPQFIFTNLVEFDSKWGHRRDVLGYAAGIEDFDIKLAKLLNAINHDDLVIISSDHGNDPTAPGTDHTREYLPVTIFNQRFVRPRQLPIKMGLGTIGNIIAKNYGIPLLDTGEDVFDDLV